MAGLLVTLLSFFVVTGIAIFAAVWLGMIDLEWQGAKRRQEYQKWVCVLGISLGCAVFLFMASLHLSDTYWLKVKQERNERYMDESRG